MSRSPLLGAILASSLAVAGLVATSSPAYAAPPANDDITAAVTFSDLPFTATADTREATVGDTDASCGSATVWYAFTPSASARVEVTTFGSNYDTMLGVYTGPSNSPALQDCNDDAQGTLQSQIVFEAEAGVTTFISVGTCCGPDEPDQIGPGGDLVLTADLAPDPVQVTVTADPGGTVDRVGRLSLTGTITCDVPVDYFVFTDAVQRHGRLMARASGDFEGTCGPETSTWTIQAEGFQVAFGPGRASASYFFFVFDPGGGQSPSLVDQQLRLRRAR